MTLEKLFQPGTIANLQVPNRIVMPAMGALLASPDCAVTQKTIDYYVERAKGGVALIITSATDIIATFEPPQRKFLPVLDNPGKVSRLSELVDEIHQYGAKLC